MTTTLADLNLSKRAMNVLEHIQISTLEELVAKKVSDLRRYRNCGPKTLTEIKLCLAEHGIEWGPEINPAFASQAIRAKILKIDREIKRLREMKAEILSEALTPTIKMKRRQNHRN